MQSVRIPWLMPFLLLLALVAPLFAASPSYAGGLFAFTPSDHDRRCLIDLNNAESVQLILLQKKLAALPSDCHAICPFRNISQTFFVTRVRGTVLRKACLLHVTAPASLSSMGSGDIVSRGKNNVVLIYHDGNVIAVYQNGDGNFSYAYQDGSGNVAIIRQYGNNNTAGIAQFGNGNNLNLTQNGNNNSFYGVQTDGDTLSLTQNGNETDVSIQ